MERTKKPAGETAKKEPVEMVRKIPVKPKVIQIQEEVIPEISVEASRANTPIEKLPSKEIEQIPETVHYTDLAAPRPKLKYRKTGGGSLRIFGLVIKPGDVFEAYPEQIPKAFMSTLVCVSDPDVQKVCMEALEKRYPKESLFVIRPSKSQGWFNVVNTITEKQLNEKSLKLAEAEKLRDSLNG